MEIDFRKRYKTASTMFWQLKVAICYFHT